MRIDRLRLAALAPALLCAGLAAAQDTAPPVTSSEVVVTGVRNPESEVRKFVGALDTGTNERQLSRFEARAVCPAVIGLPPEQGAVVVARLRVVAAAAGVPLAKAKCRPNVMVVVTRDKKALLQSLSRDGGGYFASLTKAEVRHLIDDPAPAAAWQLGGTLSADGMEVQQGNGDQVAVNQGFTSGSRITLASRPHFVAAAVVVQADALTGLTITQLADYAAMRAYARIDPDALARSSIPTILKVLEAAAGSETPITLTRWDLDLLKGLYKSPANVSAESQRSAIAGGTNKQAKKRARGDD